MAGKTGAILLEKSLFLKLGLSIFLLLGIYLAFQMPAFGKNYVSESKNFILLKISGNMTAYINKNNRKVYYLFGNKFYFWRKGIWFDSDNIGGLFKITSQNDIPLPLRHGPLLRVKRKKIPAGFAALKVPPSEVEHKLPKAVTVHLYDLPLTMNGLVIYQKKLDFNGSNK